MGGLARDVREPRGEARLGAAWLVSVVVVYAAGALAWLLPVLSDPARLLRGTADAFSYAWRIWWFAGGFRQWGGDPFFSPQVLYPDGFHLADGELTPLQMVPAALLSRMTGPVAAYNLSMGAAIAAGGLAAYALARVLRLGRAAALLAGVVFAFSPYVAAHSQGHLPLMGFWTLPATLAALERAARAWERRRVRVSLGWGAACGGFLGLAAWSSWYYLVIFGCAAAVYAIARAWPVVRTGGAGVRSLVLAAVVALLVLAALVAPVLGIVSEGSSGIEMRWSVTQIKGAPPHAYVVPAVTSTWFGEIVAPLYTRNATEDALFVGWIPLALAAVGWRARRSRSEGSAATTDAAFGRRALAVTALVCLVASFGPFLYLGHRIPPTLPIEPPAWVVERYPAAAEAGGIPIPMPALPLAFVPGFDGMREFTRFGVVVVLAVAVAAGVGTDALRRSLSGRDALALAVCAALVLGVYLEFLPRTNVADAGPRPLDEWLRTQPRGGAVIWLPKGREVADEEMYRATLTGKPIAFGDSSFLPGRYLEELAALDTYPSTEAMAVLIRRDVRWIVWRTSVAGPPPPTEEYARVARFDGIDVLERR